LYLFGFIYFFNFYFSLEFFSQLTAISVDKLEAGMELGFNLYRIKGKIAGSPFAPRDAEMVLKAPKELTEADINRLKEISANQERFDVPVRGTSLTIPFAPFIIASALFIIVNLLLRS
jgi:hypothetical protein